MNGLRFKVGELAIYVVARGPRGLPYLNHLVEVVAIGPWLKGDVFDGCRFTGDSDYIVEVSNGNLGEIADWQLRKIDPPTEPESMKRMEECEVKA